ncbi:MAG: DMT family transporter [Pseudomonadota bacterium]|nr:MAG: EamA/RhaT family transporter [Pseudomonadota bacterium]
MSVSSSTATRAPSALALGALLAAALAMGLSPVFVRLADVGPFASAFWRVALALPLLWLWMQAEERGRQAGAPRRFGRGSVLAGLFFAGDLFFWHLAIMNTTIANATFFATTAPLFVVLASWLVLRRRVAGPVLVGLVFCLMGGAALIGQSLDIAPERLAGDGYGIATAVFFGLYFLAVEHARKTTGAARVTFESSLVTSAILLVVALVMEPHILPQSVWGLSVLVALAWFSHAGGQGLLAFALGHLPATFSSLVIFLEAVFAAAFGWLIAGEALTLVQTAGGLLILFGIWLARPKAARAAADHQQPAPP